MTGNETMTEETVWTETDLQKLLVALKNSIPAHGRTTAYSKGIKTVDWKKVAFPPFSPEACQKKFSEILQKMRKIRSLLELIDEAEGAVSTYVPNIKKIPPEPPKRPSLPNAIFSEEKYDKYKKKHPEMSHQNVLKHLSEKYRELPSEEKAHYEEKFELAAEEYGRRLQEFCKQCKSTPYPKLKANHKRKRLSAKDEERFEDKEGMPPKPPGTGFHIFAREQRLPISACAQLWQELTETQKAEYIMLCRELNRQYNIKLHKYLMTLDQEKQQQIPNEKDWKRLHMDVAKKVEKDKKVVFLGEPKMPSRSGNGCFLKHQMPLLKTRFSKSRERLGNASRMWLSLSDKERQRYDEEASENYRKYLKELQEWFNTLTAAEQQAYRKYNPSKSKYLGDDDNDKSEDSWEEELSHVYRPSDSEDEDIEDSSSDEEENNHEVEEEEEEEEDDDKDGFLFELY